MIMPHVCELDFGNTTLSWITSKLNAGTRPSKNTHGEAALYLVAVIVRGKDSSGACPFTYPRVVRFMLFTPGTYWGDRFVLVFGRRYWKF
jgi:hypothetical protein